jgi:hypothetical protein
MHNGLVGQLPKQFDYVPKSYFVDAKKDCVAWRWRLKEKCHKLSA